MLALSRSHVLVCGGLIVSSAAFLSILTALPGFPRSLRGLLVDQGSFAACIALAVAMLWFGAGGVIVGERACRSAVPWLALPAWTFVAGLVSLLLLRLAATEASLSAIVGDSKLYDMVSVHGAREHRWLAVLEVFPGRAVVDFVERAVRYVSLCGPLFIALGIAHVLILRALRGRGAAALLILCAMPWLWLCKGIAFDWPATENLNQLIALPGPWGVGGGGYLYG